MKVTTYKQINGRWQIVEDKMPMLRHFWFSFLAIKQYYRTKLENYFDRYNHSIYMNDEKILEKGGSEREIEKYANMNGADLEKSDLMHPASEIVSYVKNATKEIYGMMYQNIDFMGCSESYVEEKINALTYALKELKHHCKEVNKLQNKI